MGDPETARAHSELAARQLARGEHGAALESLVVALRVAPGLGTLWAQFSDLIRYFNLRHPATPLRELLARALAHPAVDPGDLVRPISTLALSHPQGALAEPLLLRLLEDVVIRDAALERVIVDARRRMLEEPLPMPVMVAIAHQCFNAEYVFDETEEERTALERLKVSDAPSCASLARRQIVEPAEERRLAAAIPALSKEASAVSAAVRAQYEANPYPRWVRLPWVAPQAGERLSILIAGCGTGQQAILTAQRYPASRVLAVDLSLASLGYAARKTLEAGIRNIEYRQADILALGALQERFDLIECSGVLHHLEDPLEGWRILAGLRKPGARMRIGLYSELGRRAVVRARELIAARGFKPDAQGIRAARAEIRNDPQLEQLARNEDFYSMSGCRDLLFHVQEQRFTLPGIEAALAALGLEFVEFEFADSGASLQRYRSRFSDERDLKSWARFEEEFPDTFSRMYQFQVR
jgi:SAM-dependent methyltransferase